MSVRSRFSTLCLILVATSLTSVSAHAQQAFRNPSAFETLTWLPETQPDARIRYGEESAVQFGDLRLPEGEAPEAGYPVIVFLHGGAWHADWTKDYSEKFVEELTKAGYATWDIEFRRLGNEGGGFPGTFQDVGLGVDYVRTLANDYPLNLDKVVLVGHSSGGQLALWAAGRKSLPEDSQLVASDPLPLAGVVSLAGVNDLEEALELGDRTDGLALSGIAEGEDPAARFGETSPARLLPLGTPQLLMVGTLDSPWRITMTEHYDEAAKKAGDTSQLVLLEGANHFDVVDSSGPVLDRLVVELSAMLED